MCAPGEKAQALLGRSFSIAVGDWRNIVNTLVQADEEIQLIAVLAHRPAAQTEVGITDFGRIVADLRLKSHADVGHVLHDDFREHALWIWVRLAVRAQPITDFGPHFCLCLA